MVGVRRVEVEVLLWGRSGKGVGVVVSVGVVVVVEDSSSLLFCSGTVGSSLT